MNRLAVPRVSIIVCTYNDGLYLKNCIDHILDQSIADFELIIMDDASTDNTAATVASFTDSRIRYFRQPQNSGSMGRIRMLAVEKARGEYVFFTDGDCYASKDWIQTGIDSFVNSEIAAVEGRIVYYKDNYRPTLADGARFNEVGGSWMTGNMAYRKSILDKYRFNPSYPELEDRELALRILKNHSIPFVPTCLVYHQKKTMGVRPFFRRCTIGIQKVRLVKEQNDTLGNRFRIFDLYSLRIMIFPPFILGPVLRGRVKSWSDFKILLFMWPASVYTRFLTWKTAIKERVFVI